MTNLTVVIYAQVSDHHVVHFKLMQVLCQFYLCKAGGKQTYPQTAKFLQQE